MSETNTMKKTVKEVYEAAGWTAPQLAAEMGINQVTIYRWQSGVSRPRSDLAMKFAELCGVYMEDIDWGGKEESA